MLEAAAEQKSVKRVVLTSSSSAAILPKPNVEGIVVTEGKTQTFPLYT
jgi:nucleoside-diphosphate-sugar epimerase